MDSPTQPSRRHVIATAGVGLGAITLTSCGGGEDTSGEQSEKSGKSNAKPGTELAMLADIEVGQAKKVKSGGDDVIVARTSESAAVAFSAKCTHKGCAVEVKGKELNCPCHGSKFEATTGKVTNGPAEEPLPSVDVHVEGGKVITGKK